MKAPSPCLYFPFLGAALLLFAFLGLRFGDLPPPPDAPRLSHVGQGYYIFGHAAETPHIVPRQLQRTFRVQHQALAPLLGEQAPPFVAFAYSILAILALAYLVRRRSHALHTYLLLLLLLSTPAIFGAATAVGHQQAGLFWLLLTAILCHHLRHSQRWLWPALAALVAATMAVSSDHGACIAIALLLLYHGWRFNWPRPGTNPARWARETAPIFALAPTLLVGWRALKPNAERWLQTLDARFFLGFDHLIYAGHSIIDLIPLPLLLMALVWLFWVVVRFLRQRTLRYAESLAVILVIVHFFDLIVIREPWALSNTYYLAVAACIGSAHLLGDIILALRQPRTIGARLAFATAIVATAGLMAAQGLASHGVSQWDAPRRIAYFSGYRPAAFEGPTRLAFILAESKIQPGQVISFGPELLCSLECATMGAPKRFLPRRDLLEGQWPPGPVLLRASDLPMLPSPHPADALLLGHDLAMVNLAPLPRHRSYHLNLPPLHLHWQAFARDAEAFMAYPR